MRVLMLLRLVLLPIFIVGGASSLNARPVLKHASPGPSSVVRKAPPNIDLSFSETLRAGSDAVVRNADGGIVSSGKAKLVGNGAMQVPVTSLPPGKYRVEWYAASADRPNQGSFNFFVEGKESTARASEPRRHRPRAR